MPELHQGNVCTPDEHRVFLNFEIQVDLLVDEVDGFNFLTCHTEDSFWSVAALFWKPYQPNVWLGIGCSLLLTGSFALSRTFVKLSRFLPFKFLSFIFFNLIEVEWHPGKVILRLATIVDKIYICVLASGRNRSYKKGLNISYLSAPWPPNQEWNYFHEMKNFLFALSNQILILVTIGRACSLLKGRELNYGRNVSWYEILYGQTKFGIRLDELKDVGWMDSAKNYSEIYAAIVLTFPSNETSRIFTKIATCTKVTMAGLNSEIDVEFIISYQNTISRVSRERKISGHNSSSGISSKAVNTKPNFKWFS